VVLAVGNRVLVKNQTDPIENGIYVVTVPGAGGTMVRSQDMENGDVIHGTTLVGVQEGTPYPGGNEDTFWFVTTNGALVVGTDPLLWSIYPTSGIIAQTSFVYRPGEPTPAGNVYADFNLLYAAMTATSGQKLLLFDDSLVSPCPIPAGALGLYDLSGIQAQGIQPRSAARVPVLFTGGQCSAFFDRSTGLRFTAGAIPAVLLTVGDSSIITENCRFEAPGAGVFFRADGADLQVRAEETVFIASAVGTLQAINGGEIELFLYDHSALFNTLATDATGNIDVEYDGTTTTMTTDSQVNVGAGLATYTYLDPLTTFVFRPTEPDPAFNVFADWGLLYAALTKTSNAAGPRTILFDNTLVSPAACVVPATAAYDFENVALAGLGCGIPNFPTPVSFADGVIIDNLCSAVSLLDLRFSNTVAPVVTLADGKDHSLSLDDVSSLTNDPGTAPVIDITVAPTSLALLCHEGSGIDGVSPVIHVSAGCSLLTALYNGSYTNTNTLSSDAGGLVGTTYDDTSYTQTQAGVSAATWTRAALDAPPLRRVVVAADVLNPNTDGTLSCDTSAALGIINITLPALTADIVADGQEFTIKNEDGAFDVTLTPAGADPIDEVAGVFSLASLGAGRISVTLVASVVSLVPPIKPANWLLI
jgi:hypothetical protein